MVDRNSTLYSLLKMGEFVQKDFDEMKLSKALGIKAEDVKKLISSNKDFLRITNKSESKCPCGATVQISSGISFAPCKKCGQRVDINKISTLNIGIKHKELCEYFLKEIKTTLQNRGWKIKEENKEMFTALKSGIYVCCSVGLFEAGLQDYFLQRGWANDSSVNAYLLVRPVFDAELVAYMQKDLKCICIGIPEILDEKIYKGFESFVSSRIDVSTQNQELEKRAGLVSEDFGDLMDIKRRFDEIVHCVSTFARQKGDISSSAQGKQYQKYIVALLNLSLLRTKLLTDTNEPDGVIYLFPKNKKVWCPVEIKTSKAEIFKVKDVSLQIRKYCEAFNRSFISDNVDVKYFILIANDFNSKDKYTEDILNKLEENFPFRFVLFPLSSVLRMANLFNKAPPIYLPPEEIIEFFQNKRYITTQNIDELYSKLKEMNNIDSQLFSYIRETVAKYGT